MHDHIMTCFLIKRRVNEYCQWLHFFCWLRTKIYHVLKQELISSKKDKGRVFYGLGVKKNAKMLSLRFYSVK